MVRRRTAASAALLIGIGYEDNGVYTRLETSHRDTCAVKELLISTYGVREDNIHTLLDDGQHERPTKAAIEAAIQSFVRKANAGDPLFFYYNGHGDQKECNDPREDDGLDEALVPCDATENGDTWIVDNFLKETLVKKLPVNARLVAIFDMCHSGTALDLPHYDCYRHELDRASSFKDFCRRRLNPVRNSIESKLSRRSVRTSEERSNRAEKRVVISDSSPRPISILSPTSDITSRMGNSLHVQIDPQLNHSAVNLDSEKLYTPHAPVQSISQAISLTVPSGDSAIYEEASSTTVPGCLSSALSVIITLPSRIHSSLSRPFKAKKKRESVMIEETVCNPASSRSRHATADSKRPLINTRDSHQDDILSMGQSQRSSQSPISSFVDEVRRTSQEDQCESPMSGSFSNSSMDIHYPQHQRRPQTQRKLSGSETESQQIPRRPRAPGRGYTFPKDAHHAYIAPSESDLGNDPHAKSKRRRTEWRHSCAHGDDDTLLWGQVISIGASKDEQLTFEQTEEEMATFTQILIECLRSDPHPTYKQLMLDVRRKIHKISNDVYKSAIDIESKGVLDRDEADFVDTVKRSVAVSKTGYLQEPELSSARFMNIGTTRFMK